MLIFRCMSVGTVAPVGSGSCPSHRVSLYFEPCLFHKHAQPGQPSQPPHRGDCSLSLLFLLLLLLLLFSLRLVFYRQLQRVNVHVRMFMCWDVSTTWRDRQETTDSLVSNCMLLTVATPQTGCFLVKFAFAWGFMARKQHGCCISECIGMKNPFT